MTPTTRPLERLAYACYMALLISSIPGAWLGLLIGFQSGDFRGAILAVVGLGLSRCLHVVGHARWHFRECDESLTFASHPGASPGAGMGSEAADEVAELIEKFEAEPDIWERADLRRKITARLSARPQLRETFRDSLSSHPDL